MDQRTEQDKMNHIHSGWEKFKETQNPETISKEFDQEIERKMMDANGLRPSLTESEKVQAEADFIANNLSRFYIHKASEQLAEEERNKKKKAPEIAKRRRVKLYMGVAILVSLGTAVLCKDQIGGAVKDVVRTIVEYDNQVLEDEYETMSEQVYNDTGMTPEEIMEKGRNY